VPDNPIEKQLSDLVFQVAGMLRWGFNTAAADLDLPPMQAMALANLRSPAPMRDLAEWLHCDASNVTGIVDGLERRGLVTRQSSPTDRRVKHLVLTEEGERRRDLLHARSAENARAIFGLPDADREQLRDLLARLLNTVHDHPCH
jgi:DNA-binding MarR family transcriptional regulator